MVNSGFATELNVMSRDVHGLYAILGLDPSASHEAIGTAFRRKAKELHPDVAGTGNAHAFMSLRKAYDILRNPAARAAYDHISQHVDERPVRHGHVAARPPNANRNARAWFLALTAILLLSAGSAIWLEHSQVNANAVPSGVNGSSIAGAAFPKSQMYYVSAAESPLPIWHKALRGEFVQDGFIQPFTSIKLLQSRPTDDLAEVRFADGSSGYMDPHNIRPGDAKAAKEAYCLYKPGPPLSNQRILDRIGSGPNKVTIENKGDQPAVVIMRSALGVRAVRLLVDAHSTAFVDQFPSGLHRPEFRLGDSWSQKCNDIFGHRHTQRFPDFHNFKVRRIDGPGGETEHDEMQYTITSAANGNTKAEEMSDGDFDRE